MKKITLIILIAATVITCGCKITPELEAGNQYLYSANWKDTASAIDTVRVWCIIDKYVGYNLVRNGCLSKEGYQDSLPGVLSRIRTLGYDSCCYTKYKPARFDPKNYRYAPL